MNKVAVTAHTCWLCQLRSMTRFPLSDGLTPCKTSCVHLANGRKPHCWWGVPLPSPRLEARHAQESSLDMQNHCFCMVLANSGVKSKCCAGMSDKKAVIFPTNDVCLFVCFGHVVIPVPSALTTTSQLHHGRVVMCTTST